MKTSKKSFLSYLPRNGAFYAIIIFVVFFSITAPNYFTLGNLINVLRQSTVFCIITATAFMALLTHQIDLSVGASAALTSVLAALILQNGGNVVVAILVAIAAGIAVGMVNGILISRTTLAPFIVTFATQSICESLGLIITGGQTVTVSHPVILGISKVEIFGVIPVAVLIMIGIYLILWYVMTKRSFGTSLYAIGGNVEASIATGIPVARNKFIVYLVNGALAAVAGLVLIARIGTANASQGSGLEFEGICGAVLGGTALGGGRGKVWGAFLGAFAIAILKNGLNMLGLKTGYQMILIGIIIILIISLDSLTNRTKGGQD